MKIDIGYAWGQLMQARWSAAEHSDPEVRERAQKTVAKWEAVIAGMEDGSIDVGSRTPTKAPAWVTLDVVHGGFATGGYTAGGPLRPRERAMAERWNVPATRVALNLRFLESDEPLALLESGRYRIDVPEEGALMAVAWLRANGKRHVAQDIINQVAPWFGELRFYPAPADRAPDTRTDERDTVRLQDVGVTVDGLAKPRRQHRLDTMRAAITVWRPLHDRALAVFAETMVDDELARRFPTGWRDRVNALVADRATAGTPAFARAKRAARLIDVLRRCAADPASVAAADYARIRHAIARHVQAHGGIGRRADDADAIAAPLHADLRRVLVDRLRDLPRDAGLDLDAMSGSITDDEAARSARVPPGASLPPYMIDKLARSWDAPLETLIERSVIPSSEVLARVLPQITARVRSGAIRDVALRRLYATSYTAFRRRRGLLLLYYQNQVRFHELPWIAAIEALRRGDDDARARARSSVARVTGVAIRAFPHTITPNKLVTELCSLAAAAEVKLPLVEELAADIFMGSFTGKFVEAAKVSARLLAGTLYQRYYAIDAGEIARMPVPEPKQTSAALAALCERRAAAGDGAGYGVARNGKVIEQAQILTTHNLGVLFDELALRDRLAADLRPLAEACFGWIVRELRLPVRAGHELSIRIKNCAYAWRQMVFYLSFVDDVGDFVAWARGTIAGDVGFAARFAPALRGLELAAGDVASSDPRFELGGGRVFTGWSTSRHWLSPA